MPYSHKVSETENIAEIAKRYGVSAARIWSDRANEPLRALREDGFNLMPGDTLHIPDRGVGQAAAQTGKAHVFQLRGDRVPFRVRLLDHDEVPRAGLPYVLQVAGHRYKGETATDGLIAVLVPADAKAAELTLDDRGLAEAYQFRLGDLRPVACQEGIDQRLYNLGLSNTATPGQTERDFACQQFAQRVGLKDPRQLPRALEHHYRNPKAAKAQGNDGVL